MAARRDNTVRRGRARTARRALVATLLVGALGLTAACTGRDDPSWRGGASPSAGTGVSDESGPKVVATITGPAPNSTEIPAAAEVTYKTENATDATVELKDDTGATVDGEMREDGSSWVPGRALKYSTTYTVTVTATGDEGRTAVATSTFTTMGKPSQTARSSSFLGDDMVVGVGMPIIINFGRSVPTDMRDDVQRRLFVESTPRQEGSWHWVSGTEVRYRPKTWWKANTKIHYRVAMDGQPMGGGFYGRSDYTVDFKIGNSVIMTVNDSTHKMTVIRNGKVVKTIPVSLGRPSMPSSSGTMLIIQKHRKTVFDTMNDPNPANRYRTPVEYAQRLTWGGEFIHAAPWSVGDQGRRNVSHGCINMSTANAKYLFGLTNNIGDPVTVKGTPRKLQAWNGWTDWNVSWSEWIKGSAIPYRAPSADPAPTASPTGG